MRNSIRLVCSCLLALSTGWAGDPDRILSPDDFQVHQDPQVKPPVVDNADFSKKGRIVVNLRQDGSLTDKDHQILENDDALKAYVSRSKDEFVAAGKEPVLHLRGDKETVFKNSRKVIQTALQAGVSQVIFAVYENHEKVAPPETRPEDRIQVLDASEEKKQGRMNPLFRPREQDLNMSLPSNDADDAEKKKVFVRLNEQGQVFIGKDQKPMDRDANQREIPLLKAELEKIKAEGQAFEVIVEVSEGTVQQRVIDLLNTFSAAGISSVKFADLIR